MNSYRDQEDADDIFQFWQSELSSLTLTTFRKSEQQQDEKKEVADFDRNINNDNLSYIHIEDDDDISLPLLKNFSLLKERTIQNISIQRIENNISQNRINVPPSERQQQLIAFDQNDDTDEIPHLFNSNFHIQTERSITMKSILDLNKGNSYSDRDRFYRSIQTKKSIYNISTMNQGSVLRINNGNDGENPQKMLFSKDPFVQSKSNFVDIIDQQHNSPVKNTSFEHLYSGFQLNSQVGSINTETLQNEDQTSNNDVFHAINDNDIQRILTLHEVRINKDEFKHCIVALYERKYKVKEFLSKSCQTLLLSGYHTETQQRVAIKLTFCQKNDDKQSENMPNNIKLKMTEAYKLIEGSQYLQYPLKTHDYFCFNHTIIQVMDLCKKDLGKLLKEKKNNAEQLDEKLKILLQLLNSLVEIHTNGIIHLNIKPGNILFDEQGNIKLTDFSIYKKHLNDQERLIKNTFNSPEQFSSLNSNSTISDSLPKVDEKSDIYSMGLVFLRILGVYLNQEQVTQIRQGIFQNLYYADQIADLINFIKYHMLCCKPEQRKSAVLLQLLLVQLIENKFDLSSENDRIQQIINKLKGNSSTKKYLSYLYCLQGQTYKDSQLKHQFFYSSVIVSKLIPGFCPVSYFYFSNLFAFTLLQSNIIERGQSILLDCVDQLQRLDIKPKNSLLAYSFFLMGESFLILNEYQQSIKYHSISLSMKESIFQEACHPDIAKSLSRLSEIYSSINDIQKSLEYYLRTLSMREQLQQDSNQEMAELLRNIGDIYFQLKSYNKALHHYLRSLKIMESIDSYDTTDIQNTRFKVGKIYIKLHNFQEALEYLLKVLQTKEENQDDNDNENTTTLRYISYLYFKLDDKVKSLDYYLKVLKTCSHTLQFNSLDEADSLIYIAELYEKLGDNRKAIEYYLTSITTREKLAEKEHPNSARSLNKVGKLFYILNDDHRAIQYSLQAYFMSSKLFQNDHPDIIQSLNTLGISYIRLGQYEHALKQYQRILQIKELCLMSNHPDIILALIKVGKMYEKLDDNLNALNIYQRILQIRQKKFIGDHTEIADSLNQIGMQYFRIANYYRARQFVNNGLLMRQRIYKKDHTDLVESLNNMAIITNKLKDYSNSSKYNLQVLEMNQRLYDGDHPAVVKSYQNLAILHSIMGDHLKSIEYYLNSLQMQENLFKDGDPEIGITLFQLGLQYQKLGDYKKSQEFHVKSILMMEKFVNNGKSHQPAINQFNLATHYQKQGFDEKALEHYQKAIQICEQLFN